MINRNGGLSGVAWIGTGGCGMNMLESWQQQLPDDALCIGIDRDGKPLREKTGLKHKFALRNVKSLGSTVEYAESVQTEVQSSIDEQMSGLMDLIGEQDRMVVLAGLGGVIGTWASQIICNHLVSKDKQVVTVLVMPFDFERERVKVAEESLSGFDGDAHRVLCFNDYLIKHTPDGTSMQDAFQIMNEKAFELCWI